MRLLSEEVYRSKFCENDTLLQFISSLPTASMISLCLLILEQNNDFEEPVNYFQTVEILKEELRLPMISFFSVSSFWISISWVDRISSSLLRRLSIFLRASKYLSLKLLNSVLIFKERISTDQMKVEEENDSQRHVRRLQTEGRQESGQCGIVKTSPRSFNTRSSRSTKY